VQIQGRARDAAALRGGHEVAQLSDLGHRRRLSAQPMASDRQDLLGRADRRATITA
jgi:hypothetical protein